jgi:hypothetical protein
MCRLLLVVLVFAVGLAAAGSAGSGAPLNVTVAVLDGFGAGLSCGGHGGWARRR